MAVLNSSVPILPGKFDTWKEFHDSVVVVGSSKRDDFLDQIRLRGRLTSDSFAAAHTGGRLRQRFLRG